MARTCVDSCSTQRLASILGGTESLMTPKRQRDVGDSYTLEYPDAELVVGLVCAVGTDYGEIRLSLEDLLRKFDYTPQTIAVSSYFHRLNQKLNLGVRLFDSPEDRRISSRMNVGNKVRKITGRSDFLAFVAASEIARTRKWSEKQQMLRPEPKRAHIVLTLKRPEEVDTLRKIYGSGFFLVGVFATEEERLKALHAKNISKDNARHLVERDQDEEMESGQRTRETFQLADVFVRVRNGEYKGQLERFLSLVFSDPYISPSPDEHAMFLAYAASLRSCSLARQVGAAVSTPAGEILSVGCNDVPSPGGGLYWPGEGDARDHILGEDSNDSRKRDITDQLIARFQKRFGIKAKRSTFKKIFADSLLYEITEFGRSVHAEMDALLSCARAGVSPQGSVLYTTTFPCHTCTRHIVAAGVTRVVYIEPYPKSKAKLLHKDAINVEETDSGDTEGDTLGVQKKRRIPFENFVGIGPRRFFDLFSVSLSTGYTLERKKDGRTLKDWVKRPRVPLLPTSYLHRERYAVKEIDSIMRRAKRSR